MAFPFLQLGILAGSIGIRWIYGKDAESKTVLPKPQLPEFEFPRSEPGTPFPFVYGRTRVTPLVSWWGGGERGEDTSTGGYVFTASLLYTIGVPCWDEATAPWSDWRTAYPPKLTAIYQGDIKHPLAGGAGVGHADQLLVGGVSDGTEFLATAEFFDGRTGQDLSGSFIRGAMLLAGSDTSRIPGYRHRMMLGLTECQFNSTTAPAFSFEVEALGPDPVPDGVGSYDANPAWIIYDLMCSPVWKMGRDPDSIDLASFTAAAATLVTEANGASIVVYETDEISLIIGTLLEQIDATLFEDPNGLIKLKLIRADYDIGLIPTLSMANQLTRPKINLAGWKGRFTGITVTFPSRAKDYRPDTVQGGRLANAAALGGQRAVAKFTYSGVTSATLAASIAARELAVLSRPLMTVSVRINREGYDLLPGDAVKANWPTLGIVDKVFRVLMVDLGQLADGGIELTLVEDAFDQVAGAFPLTPVDSPYLLPIVDRLATEAPYWMTNQLAAQSIIASPDTYRALALAANRYDANATAFQTQAPHPFTPDAWIRDVPGGAGFTRWASVATTYPRTAEPYDTGVGLELTASSGSLAAVLTTLIGTTATTAQIQTGQRLCVLYDATGAHEFLAFEDVTGGGASYTLEGVWRGLLDTAARDWGTDATLVYLGTGYVGNVGRVGVLEGDALVRWQPYGAASGAGVRVTDTLAVIGRPVLPLPAQDFTVTGNEADGTVGQGGSGYLKEVTDLDGSLDVDARPRSRTLGVITRGTSADQGVEAGTTWALVGQRMAAHGFALEEDEIVIVDGLTSPSTTGVLLGGIGHGSLDLKLRTVNGAFESWTDPTIRVEAPSFRNLLRNGNGAELDAFGNPAAWSNDADTFVAQAGTAPRQWLVIKSVFIPGVTPIYNEGVHSQTVDVSGYHPAGLSAVLTWQHQATTVASTMQYTVDLVPLDAAGVVLAGTATTGVATSQATLFKTSEISIATLPALTAQLKVRISAISYDDVFAFTEIRLVLGQQGSQLLTNPTFDT